MNSSKTKRIAQSALFTAIIAASAWISIPTPFGINLTFSLFGIGLAAFCLGVKGAVASTVVYILLGAAGLPVFSLFSGGVGVLLGASGGFIWGFLIIAVLCGVTKTIINKPIKYTLIILSILLCHAAGVTQYCVVTGNGLWISFLSASMPFLVKDIIILLLAQLMAKKIKI